jgi:hypothetical protein
MQSASSFTISDLARLAGFLLTCKQAFILYRRPPREIVLVYDRELRDLVLVYKSIFGCIDLNIEQFVSFVQHSRSHSQNPSLVLKPSYCKTSTFQASFFNRVVKP